MREIKFRAWDKQAKKMFRVLDIDFQCSALSGGGGIYPIDSLELMQYTELKDKNGKEIYEEDIIKFEDGDKKTVEFKEGSFSLIPIASFNKGHNLGYMYKWGKIIGNIHENPELIKKKDC